MGDKRSPHCHASLLLQEVIIHLKICGSQSNFQQLNNGFGLQDNYSKVGTKLRQQVAVAQSV
jgi:hypothetical protein